MSNNYCGKESSSSPPHLIKDSIKRTDGAVRCGIILERRVKNAGVKYTRSKLLFPLVFADRRRGVRVRPVDGLVITLLETPLYLSYRGRRC